MYISVQNRQSPAQREAAEEERKKQARLTNKNFKRIAMEANYRFVPTFATDRVENIKGEYRYVVTLSPRDLGFVNPIKLRSLVLTAAGEGLDLYDASLDQTREIWPNEKFEFMQKKKRPATTLEIRSL